MSVRGSSLLLSCLFVIQCLSMAFGQEPARIDPEMQARIRVLLDGTVEWAERFEKPEVEIRKLAETASAYELAGDHVKAVDIFERARKLATKGLEEREISGVHLNLAERALDVGNRKAYEEEIAQALATHTEKLEFPQFDAAFLIPYARTLARGGKKDDANGVLKRIGELCRPGDSLFERITIERSGCYKRLGDVDGVTAMIEELVALAVNRSENRKWSGAFVAKSLSDEGLVQEARRLLDHPKLRRLRLSNITFCLYLCQDDGSNVYRPLVTELLESLTADPVVVAKGVEPFPALAKNFGATDEVCWIASALALLDRPEDAVKMVEPIMSQNVVEGKMAQPLADIALAFDRKGSHDVARKLLDEAFTKFRGAKFKDGLSNIAIAQARIGALEESAKTIDAMKPTVVPRKKGAEPRQHEFVLTAALDREKAKALAALALGYAKAKQPALARQRIEEALTVYEADKRGVRSGFGIDEVLEDLTLAEYEVGSIEAALEVLGKRSLIHERSNCSILFEACSRKHDIAGLETIVQNWRPALVWFPDAAVNELEQGRGQDVLTWLPKIKEEYLKRLALLAITEKLRKTPALAIK